MMRAHKYSVSGRVGAGITLRLSKGSDILALYLEYLRFELPTESDKE